MGIKNHFHTVKAYQTVEYGVELFDESITGTNLSILNKRVHEITMSYFCLTSIFTCIIDFNKRGALMQAKNEASENPTEM